MTFDLAVTLIRSFRRGIHPGALCHTPKSISSKLQAADYRQNIKKDSKPSTQSGIGEDNRDEDKHRTKVSDEWQGKPRMLKLCK